MLGRCFFDPFGVVSCILDLKREFVVGYSVSGRPYDFGNYIEVAFGHGYPQKIALIVKARRSVAVEDCLFILRRHDFPAGWVLSVVVAVDIEKKAMLVEEGGLIGPDWFFSLC